MKILNQYHFRRLVLATLCILGTTQLMMAQGGVSLRWVPNWDCDKEILTATVQVKADAPGDQALGTSSIYITYNTQALIFNDYTSLNFHEKNLCVGGAASAWDKHAFDGTSKPGHFNMTMVLNLDGVSCPQISDQDWTDVGQVSFSVIDKSQKPDIQFNPTHTHFNGNEFNNGTAGYELDQVSYPEIEAWECGMDISRLLTGFNVRQQALNALLKWNFTKIPVDGSSFEIERSFDSQIFNSFGSMSVMDNPNNAEFSYMDEEVDRFAGQTVFYRIKLVNPEGDFTYSSIQSLDIERLEEFPLALSPNPASSMVEVSMNLPQDGLYNLSVLNPLGQRVLTESLNAKASFTNVQLDVSDLTPGVYIINLVGDSHVGAAKLTVK